MAKKSCAQTADHLGEGRKAKTISLNVIKSTVFKAGFAQGYLALKLWN